jgi:acetylornithine deacetylase/succinyl-diaminopimelate desuccinylase-like protein
VRADDTIAHVESVWADDILEALQRFIAIPNVSPAYDPDWVANGYMAEAVTLVSEWCGSRPIAGLTVEVVCTGQNRRSLPVGQEGDQS